MGFLLTRVGATLVALPPALPYVVLAQLGTIISFNTYRQKGEVSALSRVPRTFDICAPAGALLVVVAATVGLCRVTGTGAGQLAALGAGEARISERARRDLGRAHAWMSALAVFFVMLSLICFVSATRVGTRSKLTGRLITESYAIAVVLGGLALVNTALAFFPWWHTLKSASALVADAVAETRQLIERRSPTSPEWESEVLPSVLGLCDETLPRLSEGWGDGVGFVFLGWWFVAAGFFALFLEAEATMMGVMSVLCVLTPLVISYDAAAASSDCDGLTDVLNNKRMRGDANDKDVDHAITLVEKILDRQNTKQGLGFTVGQRVMDLKTLGNIVAAIGGFATTAVPILFSLRPSTVSIGADACDLSAAQVAIVKGAAQVAIMMGNETCAYNVTISEILGM
jgi:hypothetical protein